MIGAMKHLVLNVNAFLTRRRMLFSILLALALAALLAVYNVSSGPLSNLNDIGGWSNRALFIAMAAAVHALVLVFAACLSDCCFARTALRQLILTAGMYIMQIAINLKTYAFVEVMLPAIRAMQSGGLAAGLALDTGLTAPALTLIRVLSATPVYPMYMLKLMAIASMLVIAVLMMRAAQRRGLGIRTEVLLALCVILPQGFMNAAASALIDVTAAALLLGALTLVFGCARPRLYAAACMYAAACALSGACLYALPVFALALCGRGCAVKPALAAAAVLLAAQLPMLFGGAPAGDVFAGCLRAVLGMPQYAGGAPGVVNLIPRALVEEIPQYAATLRHLPQLDFVTNHQQYYTQRHFEIVMRGVALAGLAAYMGLCAMMRCSKKPALHRVLTLVLGALIVCPGATSGAWLLADVLCLYAIVAAPKLRLPACLVLFATMTSASYPMTQEVMLPMVYAFALCLAALMLLLDVIVTQGDREEKANG